MDFCGSDSVPCATHYSISAHRYGAKRIWKTQGIDFSFTRFYKSSVTPLPKFYQAQIKKLLIGPQRRTDLNQRKSSIYFNDVVLRFIALAMRNDATAAVLLLSHGQE